MPRRKSGRHRSRGLRLWPGAQRRRRWWRALRRGPAYVQIALASVAFFGLWLAVNWTYQVVRKPTELFFPVSGTLYKTPGETWRSYESLFREHATQTITPELLAALAQVEGSGNPLVRTYWRWSLTPQPFEVYRPASSAVGMYQITNGTFAEARRYCIHDNVVVQAGPWHDLRSCWFTGLYTRVMPSHAVELTAAYLDTQVASALLARGKSAATPAQKRNLAAVIHLCGRAAGIAYAKRDFRVLPAQRCGDHDVHRYLARVVAMTATFARLAAPTAT
jgi:hypothetical protein